MARSRDSMHSLLGIKQIPNLLVKLTGCLAILVVLGSATVRADEESTEKLPDIEAKTVNVKIMRRSRSGHVYVFETEGAEPLHTGKILLLKQNDQPVMAFRVLR